jgi:PAS domain S-box-containing protein
LVVEATNMSSRLRVLAACGAVIATVFVVDICSWGVAAGVPYIAAVMVALWSPRRRDVVVVAAICAGLTIVSLSQALLARDVAYGTEAFWRIWANWLLAVFAITVTTVIGLRRKRVEEELALLNATLEERVADRTAHAAQRELELSRVNATLEQEVAERRRAEQALRESEAFSQTLVESLPLNVFRKDLEGRVVFANQRYCDNLGIPYHQLLGKTDFDLFPPELAGKYRGDDRQVVETEKTWEDIEQHRRPDGQNSYVHVLKAPVRNADGAIVGTQGMFWDVTPRFQAEQAQRRSDARFRRLVESNVIGVMICNLSGQIFEANDAYLELVGYTRQDLAEGRVNWEAMTPPEHRAKDEHAVAQLRAHGTAIPWEKEYIRKDGRRVPVLLGVTLVEETSDECICFVVDISERKRAEVQLRAAKEAADAASQAKSQFLANMSHEVRTPMNAIIGMTELVLNTPLSAEQREYLTMVLDSSESLLAVINDVLDFSKVEAGKLKLDKLVFDLRETLGDTMKTLAVRAHAKSLELACHIDQRVPVNVVGDPGRLRQIVVNLVGNAIKFTDEGEVVLRAELGRAADDERDGEQQRDGEGVLLHFSVSDTGVGIPDELRAAIFFAFEQGDSSTTRRFGGTGLGLAIAASLVELMQGNIWVDSEVGKGSTFHFTARFELAPGEADAAAPALPAIVEGTRVLIVDDNATNRRILFETLRCWRMDPTEVSAVAEAIAALREAKAAGRPFRLVVSDVNMPRTDGFALARQMQESAPELGSSLILMLTSGDQPGDVARCEQYGVAAHLMKPIKQSELFDAVAMVLGTLRAADERCTTALDKGRRLPPLRVLLAEDSLVNQKLAVGLLHRAGHQVTVVSNGLQAVECARDHRFDLVLMDVQMPEMDGLEATRTIRDRERKAGGHVPIVAMTAHAMSGDRERCLAAGMDEYIAKPIRAEQLFDTIAHALQGTRRGDGDAPRTAWAGVGTLDWGEALSAVNGDQELLRDVVDAFLDESPKVMAEIRSSIGASDGVVLRRAAHTLKGSVRLFGAHQANELAYRLETMGRDADFSLAGETLASLHGEMERILPELFEYVGRAQADTDRAAADRAAADRADAGPRQEN